MALHMVKKVPGPQEIREAFPITKIEVYFSN